MRRRGSQPSCTAWRVIENAPVMIDWLAMIAAKVASSTSGTCSASGQRRKKMLPSVGSPARTIAAWPA